MACASAGCRRRSPPCRRASSRSPPSRPSSASAIGLGGAPRRRVVRQNIYTPNDTFTSQPIYNDRPYAAWLYASFALQYTYKRRDEKTGMQESDTARHPAARSRLIGPAAGGEFVQNNFHNADRRRLGQRLGEPAPQRADDRIGFERRCAPPARS